MKGSNVGVFSVERRFEDLQTLLKGNYFEKAMVLANVNVSEDKKTLYHKWESESGYNAAFKMINSKQIKYIAANANIEKSNYTKERLPDAAAAGLDRELLYYKSTSLVLFVETNENKYIVLIKGKKNLEPSIRKRLMRISKKEWQTCFNFDKSFYYWLIHNSKNELNLNGEIMKLKNVRGFKSNTERKQHSYEGSGNGIESETPLKTMIGLDFSVESIEIDIEYKNKEYSFGIDYDGRTQIFETKCRPIGEQSLCFIPWKDLLLDIYFDIIPFLKARYNNDYKTNYGEREELKFRKGESLKAIKELVQKNGLALNDIKDII